MSADVGPDLIAPWRRLDVVILYTDRVIDQSVFPQRPFAAQVNGRDVPLADPLQQIWDLEDLGGDDRIEAAGRLREWLLTRP